LGGWRIGVQCLAGVIGYIIIGFLAAFAVADVAIAHGIAAAWIYLLGIFGGGLAGLSHCPV
jgi:hypothetical protein